MVTYIKDLADLKDEPSIQQVGSNAFEMSLNVMAWMII
jgi:hypothetical protein